MYKIRCNTVGCGVIKSEVPYYARSTACWLWNFCIHYSIIVKPLDLRFCVTIGAIINDNNFYGDADLLKSALNCLEQRISTVCRNNNQNVSKHNIPPQSDSVGKKTNQIQRPSQCAVPSAFAASWGAAVRLTFRLHLLRGI